MEESRRRTVEDELIQQWKEIVDLEGEEAEDQFKRKKEQWFSEAFSFLRDLPEESHCWCGHKEIMIPLLEPFYGYFHETSSNSSLKVLWRRLSKDMRICTRCVVQHHKAKDFYISEFVEEVVEPLLDVIRALDEERVSQQMKELLEKFNTNTLDPKDSVQVICVMFEVLMFPSLLDDAEVNETIGPFLLHVEETHDLTLASGQRYPGVYSLLLHRVQGIRRIAVKLANSLPTFKDENDMESIQEMLGKWMHCLEYESFVSSTQKTLKAIPGSQGRPRATFTKEALWIGLTTFLNFLEPPAFLKGVMEKHPMFVSIVLNHISEETAVFWNALRCLKLLLEVLGYKLWLGTTFSAGVLRNTLLSQCFHSREERLHVHIFDLFLPFLTSLEALQDGEYESQRRRLLYFLLQQVPLSSNFKPMITKKARQVAFSIIGRGYTMDPPLPPVECVHFWGPPLVAVLKDAPLTPSLKQSATDLMQSIIVADSASLAAASIREACLLNAEKYSLDSNDNDREETAEDTSEKSTEEQDKYWSSFSSVTRSMDACEQWLCLPLLWVEVLSGALPFCLPLSFTKGIMWALSRLSMMDLEGMASPKDTVVVSDGVACSRDMAMAFTWAKPKGCEDGASGEGCVNAVNVGAHLEELVGYFKKYAEKYVSNLHNSGFEQGDWQWEARMAEPCILMPLDANVIFRDFGKDVLRRLSKGSSLEAGLELLCSSEASVAAVIRGLHHSVKQFLHWPLSRSSRGLQQLFFLVWKLLTLGDKEAERQTSSSQGSENGGFLNQPNFQALSVENSQGAPVNKLDKDEAAWKKLCPLISSQLWPLLVKTLVEGRKHLEGPGQLMTFTRMLQLLPCVFRNFKAAHKQKMLDSRTKLTWFFEFVRWIEVPSPIIQRWWKEAVCSILEDLKAWLLFLPSELEDLISDLRKPGLELDQKRRAQVQMSLLSVPHLPNLKMLRTPLKIDSDQHPKQTWDGDEPDCDFIDLTDSPQDPSQSAPVHRLHLHGDDTVPTLPKQLDNDLGATYHRTYDSISGKASGSLLDSSEKGHLDWPRRPPLEQRAPVPSQKKSTLDSFLVKFQSEKAARESNKGGINVQGRTNVAKLPAAKVVPSKANKAGSKLASLRTEHREVLEQRSAVEGFVRSQVRERVEKEARAKQSVAAEFRPVDQEIPNVSAPALVAQEIGGTDVEEREQRERKELRELVQDNEVDPLDAALDIVRKPRLAVGLSEPLVKPRRKLITLEMPGEGGRGGTLGRPKPGLVINPRQIPRLDQWYKQILSLDYLSVVGLSPEVSSPASTPGDRLEKVPLTFKTPEQYLNIFRPLVLEEFKSQLQRSHAELNLSDGSTTGILRLMSLERVDEFQVGRFVSEAGSDGASRACADNELVLLSRQTLQSGPQSCHVLAKMESRDRESKSRATVLLLKLYCPATDLRLSKAKRLLVDRSKWYLTRIMNITPQIREWQALSSLSSLPLLPVLLAPDQCPQIKSLESVSSVASLRCLPEPLQSKLRGDYNESQLRAIANAIGGKETMTNDHQLTLIQGPPGTGKTKTIVAILSALLALKSSKRTVKAGIENQPPISKSSMGMGGNTAIKSSSRDAAAMSRAWQEAARAKEMMKESASYSRDLQGQKQRVLVCAQSNAAVDEIVARICKNGLYGVDGKFLRPSVVRIGTLKSVHPKSLPVFIDTLVEQRLGSEKESDPEAAQDNEQSTTVACRTKLEEVIEFIQVIESLRSQAKDTGEEKNGQKAGLSQYTEKALKFIAQGEAAVTAKLNLLYNERRRLTAEVATAEKEGKKAYEESKNMRKAIRKDIIRQADVVVTTLSGSGGDIYSVCMESVVAGKKSKPMQECFFDAVVIDEAAQALEPATLIPLQLLVQTNARCVMVGDPKQLPATVLSQMASRMQYECSMFERLQKGGFPVTMLSTQYRMHPDIRQFPSKHFYDDLITDGEGLKASRKAVFHREASFGPYVFFDVVDGQESSKGSSASQSISNEAEVAVAVHLYSALKKRYPAELWEGRVGVITPYKQQLRRLQEEFGRALGSTAASEIEFNTVDGFQGREVDILILTTVRASSSGNWKSGDIGFVADLRRMNVALTRARFSMWIIGNAATLEANPSWGSLLANAEKREVIYSVQKPYAVFFQKSRPVEPLHSNRAHKGSLDRHEDRSISEINRNGTEKGMYSESSRDSYERGPPFESKRNLAGQDRERAEGVRNFEDKRQERLHQDERSGNNKQKVEKSRLENMQNASGKEKAGNEATVLERFGHLKPSNKVQNEGSSGPPGCSEETLYKETTLGHSKKLLMEPKAAGRSSSLIDAGGAGYEGKYSKQDGPAVENFGLKKRREEESHISDQKAGRNSNRSSEERNLEGRYGVDKRHCRSSGGRAPVRDHRQESHIGHQKAGESSNRNSEERNFGGRRDGVDEMHWRSSGGRAPVRDHRQESHIGDQKLGEPSNRNSEEPNVGGRRDGVDRRHSKSLEERADVRDQRLNHKGAERGHESIESSQRNPRVHMKDGEERLRNRSEAALPEVGHESIQSSRRNPHGNMKGGEERSGNGPEAARSKVEHTGPRKGRSSLEELQAARKRKRDEVSALLPSSLLRSTERSGSAVPRDEKLRIPKTRIPTAEAVRPRREHDFQMHDEWSKLQAALGKLKSAQPVPRTGADLAPRMPTEVPRKSSKDLKRSSSKPSVPQSDLDNILSGLTSVTWAQAQGRKLDAPHNLQSVKKSF